MYTQHFGVISRGNSYSVELEHNINAQSFSVHYMFQSGLTKTLWPHYVSSVMKSKGFIWRQKLTFTVIYVMIIIDALL